MSGGIVAEWDCGLIRVDGDSWLVVEADEHVGYPILADALRRFEGSMDDSDRWQSMRLHAVADLIAAADEAGMTDLFGWSPDGLVKIDGHWVPTAGVHMYDGDPEAVFELVEHYGDSGVDAGLYRYGDVYVCSWSGPEWETSGFDVYGSIPEAEARQRAEGRASEEMFDWGLFERGDEDDG